ncbi:MAG: 4Fe-4S dicluster domain-containing protein [Hyphomicrobiales bacterium]|nr:4Fe-4S dicluster domain-containing protein [Hyphomicrobiales bacterium]
MALQVNGRQLLVCNCERTMEIDGDNLKAGLGGDGDLTVHAHLCRAQVETFGRALDTGEPLLVACTQEAPLFRELAEEKGVTDIAFTNIRERAGWSEARGAALPKMAALIAEAAQEVTPAGTAPVTSEGVCLVYGAGELAKEVAEQLAQRLSVSLLLSDAADVVPPSVVTVPIYKGRIVRAAGTLGSFEITVDGYAPAVPSSRDALDFVMERNGASSTCDLIFDMSGDTSLFPAGERRDGYFRVDPNHAVGIAKAMFEISDYVGAFEKPLYVTYNGDICAHARNEQVGCSNCLDNCPLSAISPDGDTVSIDPLVCGGCGNCSAVCPTGAVSYAYPARGDLIGRCQTLLGTYYAAGGRNAVLLVHDQRHGDGLIGAMARYGRGLPANVLPLPLYSVNTLGHDALLSMLAAGAQQIVVLTPPDRTDELPALETQAALANTFMSGLGHGDAPRVSLLTEQDPDAVEAALYGLTPLNGLAPLAFTAVGGKREIARTVLGKLNAEAPGPQEVLELPEGAPYGRIQIDTGGCTLCLACVSCCPVDALADNPERPQVRFTEAACVQCGLCRTTCPENVISLEPRFDFTNAALTPQVLNEAEPFECVRCGKPFGVKASVERVIAELEGKHWMFQSKAQSELIRMCDECRVIAVSERGGDPFAEGERPRIRTTDDYIAAEAKAREAGKTPDDFLN